MIRGQVVVVECDGVRKMKDNYFLKRDASCVSAVGREWQLSNKGAGSQKIKKYGNRGMATLRQHILITYDTYHALITLKLRHN